MSKKETNKEFPTLTIVLIVIAVLFLAAIL